MSATPTWTTVPRLRRCPWSRPTSTRSCRSTPASTAAPATPPRSAPRSTRTPASIVRDFVGGRPDDAVIFTRNTTDSLNLLAGCLPVVDGEHTGEVLYLDIEHHANLLPWQRVPAPQRHRRPHPRRHPGAAPRGTRARRRQSACRDRRLQRHRRDPADPRAGRAGARLRRPDRRRRRPVGPAPADQHRRGRRRLHRLLGAQALRTLRRRRPDGPSRLARRRHPAPRRRRRRPGRPDRHRQLDHGTGPARGRLPQRPRRRHPGPGRAGHRRRWTRTSGTRTRTPSGPSWWRASPGSTV